jgi:hypothetical protein
MFLRVGALHSTLFLLALPAADLFCLITRFCHSRLSRPFPLPHQPIPLFLFSLFFSPFSKIIRQETIPTYYIRQKTIQLVLGSILSYPHSPHRPREVIAKGLPKVERFDPVKMPGKTSEGFTKVRRRGLCCRIRYLTSESISTRCYIAHYP